MTYSNTSDKLFRHHSTSINLYIPTNQTIYTVTELRRTVLKFRTNWFKYATTFSTTYNLVISQRIFAENGKQCTNLRTHVQKSLRIAVVSAPEFPMFWSREKWSETKQSLFRESRPIFSGQSVENLSCSLHGNAYFAS